MNAVIYARYSSSSQREESIEAQLEVCNRYAANHDLTVIHEYVDRAATGRNADRAGLQQMMKDGQEELFEKVLVYQFDRFMRDRYLSQAYKRRLKEHGIRVISVSQSVGEGPESIITEGFHEAFDEYYSAQLSERIKDGQRMNAEKCKFNGGAIPLGYRVDNYRQFQIDEDTAPLVRRIFQEYSDGKPIADMIKDLNAAGYRTVQGGEYNKNSFKRILTNRRYLGIYIFGQHEVPGGMPQLIDEETFDAVQLRVGDNREPNRARRDYLLTGHLFCGECGAAMVGNSGRSVNGSTYHYYVCRTVLKNGSCHKASIRREQIEKIVFDKCREVLTDENITLIASRVSELCRRELEDNQYLDQLMKQKTTLEKKIRRLLDALENGQEVELIAERIKKRKDELEKTKLLIAQEKKGRFLPDEDEITFFLTRLRDGSTDKPSYRKVLITALVNRIYLYDDRLVIHFTTSKNPPKITVELRKRVENFNEELERPVKQPHGSSDQGSFPPPCKLHSNSPSELRK
jgi:site-specific DNA recombinase